jgi:hypothetical protein
MNTYLTNLENITRTSADTFESNFKGKAFYLKINKLENTLNIKLFEEFALKDINLREAKSHRIFYNCNSVDDLKNKFDNCLLHNKARIVEVSNKYHLVLNDNDAKYELELNSLQKIQNDLNDLNYVISKHNRAKDIILNNIKNFDIELKSNITTNIDRLMNYKEKVETLRYSLEQNIN